MVDENSDHDAPLNLFGEPQSLAERGRGRPPHVPTRESENRVILGFARGWSPKKVALSIGISVPTLRQHYFSHVERREAMALMMESVQLGRLNDQAQKGNISAEKALLKALEKGRLEQLSDRVADRGAESRAAKPKKLGKKDAANAAATKVEGLYAPPEAPLLN